MFYCQGHNIFAIIYLAEHCSVCVISTNKKLQPSRQLSVQNRQQKHQKKPRNMPKVNNKDTRTTSMTSFLYLHCQIRTHPAPSSSVPIAYFEQAIAGWKD